MKTESFKSTCCYCGVGCGIVVHKQANGKLTVEGDKDHPSSKGMLCSKGMNLHYTVMEQKDRLLYPQMRFNKNMPLQRVSWDTALDKATAVFKTFIEKYGPDSVGFYASGQCLTEEYYVINKLMKGFIGSNNIDTNSRLCMSSAVVGYKLALGEDTVPVSYDDIELADCFLVAGANPAWCHPIIWRRVEAHKTANPDVKIICVDPRKTQTAAIADLHLQLLPGTDITLFNAISRILIENEWIDKTFIENYTDGFEKLKVIVFQTTLEESAKVCDVPAEKIKLAAQYIHEANGFISMWTMGLNQSVVGVNKNLSLINLNLITGKIGKPGSGPFSLTGQPNAMGGREVGGLSNLLPAHRNLLDASHRLEVENFWNSKPIAPKPGLSAVEMFEALADGRMKAIWIICTNPLLSMPDVRLVEKALKNAKFVVVQDMSTTPETIPYADVVLPAATWAEKEGTMTNSERRITHLQKITDAPGEALPDAEIIIRFAHKMGYGQYFPYKNASEIFEEHCKLTAGTNMDISGLSYQVLQEKRSVQWPYSVTGKAEEPKRLFSDFKFYTPNQKAQIHGCEGDNLSEKLSPELPLILTTGRIRDQWHTMSRTGKVQKLNQHIPQPFLEIHPLDARERNLKDNDLALIKNDRGEVKVKIKVTEDIKSGIVFLPMHWGKILNNDAVRTNNLTNSLMDARSKEPDLKFAAVEVEKYKKPFQKIVVIGAGSGGLGFIRTYRELNEQDEIHVFSKEIHPFYNRVMLPDYISGEQTWEQLVKLREEEFWQLNIVVHKGISIVNIDRNNKVITDSKGEEHSYDILILGMGSRAFMPKDVPLDLPGIFNMRSRTDADALVKCINERASANLHIKTLENAHVVIVGGGLLGLELAASLREIELQVTVVQRIGRFMDRQLDPLASSLLHEEIIDRGIEVLYNDEVQRFYGTSKLEGIRLKSGRKIDCDAIVFAVGTIPNIEIAREAGLDCNRGVTVNEYLQTSDPTIFAFGEVAEFNRQMWGITAAAEEQAGVAARFINGDIAGYYTGSLSMNIMKMKGLELCSFGITEVPQDAPEYEEIIFLDKAKRYYKKCIIRNDKLVGAILMGDKSEFLEFKELIAKGTELSEKRLQLLRSGKKAEPVIGKLVCSCNNVGEGNLINKITAGCTSLSQLCQETGAGTGCGSCRPEVKTILEKNTEEVVV
jgi:ferredoxin-nitrate reductase